MNITTLSSNMKLWLVDGGMRVVIGGRIDIAEFLAWAQENQMHAHYDVDFRRLQVLNPTNDQLVLLKLTWGGL